MHLTFCMRTAYDLGFKEHPQIVMRNLGITYLRATPQSISDEWWFWCCENLPTVLPGFLKQLKVSDPKEYVGWGLSLEMAQEIERKCLENPEVYEFEDNTSSRSDSDPDVSAVKTIYVKSGEGVEGFCTNKTD